MTRRSERRDATAVPPAPDDDQRCLPRHGREFALDERVGRALAENVALMFFGDGGMVVVPKVGTHPAPSPVAAAQPRQPTGWVSVNKAATVLGFGVVSFRRLLERNARRTGDGAVEANVDGVRARKVGRTWRVQLSDAWTTTSATPRRSERVLHHVGGSARHGGKE